MKPKKRMSKRKKRLINQLKTDPRKAIAKIYPERDSTDEDFQEQYLKPKQHFSELP